MRIHSAILVYYFLTRCENYKFIRDFFLLTKQNNVNNTKRELNANFIYKILLFPPFNLLYLLYSLFYLSFIFCLNSFLFLRNILHSYLRYRYVRNSCLMPLASFKSANIFETILQKKKLTTIGLNEKYFINLLYGDEIRSGIQQRHLEDVLYNDNNTKKNRTSIRVKREKKRVS